MDAGLQIRGCWRVGRDTASLVWNGRGVFNTVDKSKVGGAAYSTMVQFERHGITVYHALITRKDQTGAEYWVDVDVVTSSHAFRAAFVPGARRSDRVAMPAVCEHQRTKVIRVHSTALDAVHHNKGSEMYVRDGCKLAKEPQRYTKTHPARPPSTSPFSGQLLEPNKTFSSTG